MKLNFNKGNNEASVAKWNNIVVLLTSGETGEQEVMFTGVSKSGKALFAKLADGVKVNAPEGVRSTGSMCCEYGHGLDENNIEYDFTPGLMHRYLYISRYEPSFPQFTTPAIGGIYYLTQYKGDWKVAGVDDPSLLNDFLHLNTTYQSLEKSNG